MNTKYNAKILASAVPIVAAAYGRKFGVKIVFTGDRAMTDGKTIVLPSLPPDTAFKDVVWGYLAHEAGHVRFTDWKHVPTAPNRQSMLNVVEDARIELAMMRAYPGTATTLNAVANHMAQAGHYVLQTAENDPFEILFSYCLYNLQCNVVGQKGLKEFWLAAEQAFTQVFPTSTKGKLDQLLQSVVGLENTEQALKLADQILELLKQEACRPKPDDQAPNQQEDSSGGESAETNGGETAQSKPEDGQKQSDGSSDRSDNQSSSDKGNGLSVDNQNGEAGKPEDGSPDKDQQSGGSNDHSDSSSSPVKGDNFTDGQQHADADGGAELPAKVVSGEEAKTQSEARSRLQQALKEGEFRSFDPRSKLRSELFANSNQMEEQTLSVPDAISISTDAAANSKWNRRAKSAASGIRQRLSGMVQAKRRSGSISATIGKRINATDIHRVCTGDTKVFRKTWTEKKARYCGAYPNRQ